MLRRARWLALVLAGACGGGDASGPPSTPAPTAPAAAVEHPPATVARAREPASPPGALDRPITAAALRRHVEVLAADDMRGRATPSPELDRAADYLAGRFAAAGLQPGFDGGFAQRFACGGPGRADAANVIATVPGSDPRLQGEWVAVTAHYDHLGIAPAGAGAGPEAVDTIYNGANDNASGVAAMLVIAEAFAQHATAPRRTVVFVGFCGEELGFFGAQHFVAAPPLPLDQLVAVVNLEMLGQPDPPERAWITGMPRSDLGERFNAAATGVTFVDGADVGAAEGTAFARSDNWPFASAGVVAHSISAGRIGPSYHTVDDELAGVDAEGMVALVRAIAHGTWAVATDDTRPQWRPGGRP